MTTEQRPENLEKEPARPKRRSRWLILVGIVLLGVAAACAASLGSAHRGDAGGIAFLITNAGLGGLICMVLGLVRLVSNERNLK
jgi:hypothetical protein